MFTSRILYTKIPFFKLDQMMTLNRDERLIWEEGGGGAYLIWQRRWYQFSIKELKYKVEKIKYETLEVMPPRIKNKSELPVSE